MDIKYLLLFLMCLKIFVCLLSISLLFLCSSSSLVQVSSAMYYLLISMFQLFWIRIYFMFNNYKR